MDVSALDDDEDIMDYDLQSSNEDDKEERARQAAESVPLHLSGYIDPVMEVVNAWLARQEQEEQFLVRCRKGALQLTEEGNNFNFDENDLCPPSPPAASINPNVLVPTSIPTMPPPSSSLIPVSPQAAKGTLTPSAPASQMPNPQDLAQRLQLLEDHLEHLPSLLSKLPSPVAFTPTAEAIHLGVSSKICATLLEGWTLLHEYLNGTTLLRDVVATKLTNLAPSDEVKAKWLATCKKIMELEPDADDTQIQKEVEALKPPDSVPTASPVTQNTPTATATLNQDLDLNEEPIANMVFSSGDCDLFVGLVGQAAEYVHSAQLHEDEEDEEEDEEDTTLKERENLQQMFKHSLPVEILEENGVYFIRCKVSFFDFLFCSF